MAKLVIYATVLILLAAIGIEYFQKQKQEAATQRVIEFGKQNELKISKEHFKRVEFKIEFDEVKWNDLLARLDNTRYFDRLKEVPEFSFGFNPEYSKELATYWRNSFDWRKQIQRLNKYTQYRATINNTVIHYIYHETNRELHNSKSPQPQINLLLIDGWPGCSFSFNKMIEKIESEYKDMSFRIFVPSIPGYGYSTPLNRVVDAVDTAILFDALMRYENAENYFVHGEDWGIFVATILGQLFSDRVRGVHLTSADSSEFSSLSNSISFLIGLYLPSTYYTEQEIKLDVPKKYSLSNRLWVLWSELGYFHFQSTKPDTVAHGVTDSPVGLMAYVLEKYSTWSFNFEKEILGKRDGGLNKFDKDELLSIITIYWMTNSISSSVRYYKANVESFFMGSQIRNEIFKAVMPAKVPIGFQLSINEIMVTPSRAAQIRFPNMIQFELVDNLGHFAAFHNPPITANNFIKFVLKSL